MDARDMDEMESRLDNFETLLSGHGNGPAARAGLEVCTLARQVLEQNRVLRKALRFYADCTSWHRDFIGGAHVDSRAMDDMGQKAREALGDPK